MDSRAEVLDLAPKRIKELQFGLLSNKEIVQQAELELLDRNVYESVNVGPDRAITQHGPLDERMGTSSKIKRCKTCTEELNRCNGHYGYIKLALPAFHIGYIKRVVEILQCICKCCSQMLFSEDRRRFYLNRLRVPSLEYVQRENICKAIAKECRTSKLCPYCNALNGTVRKVPSQALKIVHDKFSFFNRSNAKHKIIPPSKIAFDKSFDEAKKSIPELDRHIKRAMDDVNPLRALKLFRNVRDSDCELLGFRPGEGRPEMFIWEYIPAAPVTIRPSVAQDMATTEDDITNKVGDIIEINNYIRRGLIKGQTLQTIIEQWDHLQLLLALCINSEAPGLQQSGTGKFIRGFCQRLKGKQGRFRGNLSGKRVDFSARTVISPDPDLEIDEVAIPVKVAVKMTYPEKVTSYNIAMLRNCIKRGKRHPGASYIIKYSSNRKVSLEISQRVNKLEREAEDLVVGDVVERHLIDGDIVLFNRQPSLHKLSIMSHKAKIRPFRTFRLNECVCTPYNADFDGDEMNLHVLQTEEARAEAIELMGVKNNLATPKNGAPVIAAIQDFIAAAFLLSRKDNFLDRSTFTNICGFMFDDTLNRDKNRKISLRIELPPPTIWKPQQLWTGKQVWNVLMRPNRDCKVFVNLDVPCKQYKSVQGEPPDLNEDDSWLIVRNSEVMCGVMDKSTIGDGKKDSVFYIILRDFGPDCAAQAMSRLAKLSARWLSNRGFSIGISDVNPSDNLMQRKGALVKEAYRKCEDLSMELEKSCLARDAGCDQKQTFENKCTGILNAVRQEAGAICLEQLGRWNAPSLMAKCGAKGSNINVAQMVAAVGQQTISNKRIDDGFQDRTLPHFPKASRQPPAKGFVQNSFFSGLIPTEFVFHAMTGREGLVDTAVKTAETGYMSRRLMKSLEDLSAQYDNTVRNSSMGIVQFQYGDDKLDPIDMEAKAKPVHLDRTFNHAISTTWNNSDISLSPDDINHVAHEILERERQKLSRISLLGDMLSYHDNSDQGIDGHESAREFLDTLEKFISSKSNDVSLAIKLVRELSWANDKITPESSPEGINERAIAERIAKISISALNYFISRCLTKYEKALVQPGHAVGAVGAQSIGEPGTQMTLKTFHFAGVAGMSITQGVPRIKEIINASTLISTPVISCDLSNRESEHVARIVKSRVEKTFLRDIIAYVDDVWHVGGAYISLKVDTKTIDDLQLDIQMRDIEKAIMKMKGFRRDSDQVRCFRNRIRIVIGEPDDKKVRSTTKMREEHFLRVQSMKRNVSNVVVKGYPDAHRAIIRKDDKPNEKGLEEFSLLVEGYGLKECMTTDGINGYATRTNSVMEMRSTLGIEAARKTIIDEIRSVMGQMDIDPRHMALLADVMTFKGEVLGITRFGLAKMRDSVLQLASFEKTPDHLFEAASRIKKDKIEGVSECIIMGQSMHLGTGSFKVVRQLAMKDSDLMKKDTLFEDCFARI